MKITKLVLILFLTTLIFFSCARKKNTTNPITTKSIQIKGSDTMINLTQAWTENFCKKYPNIFIGVTGGGSGTGIAAFINGSCDICQSSREMEKEEIELAKQKKINPVKNIVGWDGIAIITHPSNVVSQLTLEQIRDIFMGTISNWKNFGGNDAKIIVLSREVNSGTHLFFKEHVLRKNNPQGQEEFAKEALLLSSSQAIADEIAQNPNAIGYYGMGYISSKQKVIAIAQNNNSNYYLPTSENITSNKYSISRPLYLYTNELPKEELKKFMEYVFSEEGQEIVKTTGFVPITK